MYRRAVAILLVAILTLVSVAPALALDAPQAGARTRVSILHAASGSDDASASYPRLAAEETARILREAGGLTRVQVREAVDAAALRALIRETTSEVLIVTAHADARGLAVGGATIAWSDLRDDLAASGATYVAVGACDSRLLGEVPGKTVLTTFDGKVDRRYAAATLAHDLVQQAIPSIDPRFVGQFLLYIDAHGGFERYAHLLVAPEEPLEADLECESELREWYDGKVPAQTRPNCIYFIEPGSPNCFSERDRASELCQKLTSGDQDQVNAESSGEANVSFADGSGGTSSAAAQDGPGAPQTQQAAPKWYYYIGTVMQTGVEGGAGSTKAYVKYGSVRPDPCITLLAYDFTGGGAISIFKTLWKKFKEEKGSTAKEVVPTTENSIGLRLCGYIKSKEVNISPSAPSEFQASAALDLRVSHRATLQWEIHLWRWSYWINFGAEGGVKYPFYPAIDGEFQLCPSGSRNWARYAFDAEISGGGLQIFAYALTGYKEFGVQQDLGWTFSHDTHRVRECDATTEAQAQQSAASHALDPFLAGLLDAGLAVKNAEPTLLSIQDDGAYVFLNAGFSSVRPGTGAFRHLAEIGALDALGIPLDLPLDQQVLLDLTQPRLQELLGMDLGAPTPIVSLRDGVAIIPASIPLAAGLRGFCASPPTGYDALVAANCANVDSAPLTLATSEPGVCDPAVDPDNVGAETDGGVPPQYLGGAVTPGACHAPMRGLIEAYGDTEAAALGTACATALGPASLAPTCDGIAGTEQGSGGTTQIRLFSSIHSMFQLVQRPTQAWWLLGSCNVKFFDTDVGNFVSQTQDEIGSEAASHSVCIDRVASQVDNVRVDLGTVDEEIRDGAALLAMYAAFAPVTTVLAADPPSATDVVPGGGDVNQWVQDQLNDAWADACPVISPVWPCAGGI